MENKTKMLIAVGAAVTANCQPCLKTAVNQAQGTGADEKDIREAIAIGRIVRRGAMGKMDKLTSTLVRDGKDDASSSGEECVATDDEVKEWVEQEDQCGCGCS
jgi:AhpD family alkylhydroperoxidase